MNFSKFDLNALMASQWGVIKCRTAGDLWVEEGASWSVRSQELWPLVESMRMITCTQIWTGQLVDQKENINTLL